MAPNSEGGETKLVSHGFDQQLICSPMQLICKLCEEVPYLVVLLYYGRIHLVLNGSLTDDTSVKWAQIKTFLCMFYPILLKLGEVVVPMCTTTSPSFNKIG